MKLLRSKKLVYAPSFKFHIALHRPVDNVYDVKFCDTIIIYIGQVHRSLEIKYQSDSCIILKLLQ